MRAVLISIQPKWCELIASGKKTIEVRKTKPKLETPFKVYIYCTKNTFDIRYSDSAKHWQQNACGKVIGEFVCDTIFPISVKYSNPNHHLANREFPLTCLTDKQIIDYLGNGKEGYGWHISDLVIYDKSIELSKFRKPCKNNLYCESCAMYSEFEEKCYNKALQITRPPQSWCYAECEVAE